MLKRNQKGFTLIELLVVIAIIGLLAGIVLVSLGGARDRARDGRIQADVAQIKTLAELVYNYQDAFAYTAMCETTGNTIDQTHAGYGSELGTLETDIDGNNGTGGVPACYASGDDYCVSAVMNEGTVCISAAGSTGDDTCAAATTTCD